MRRALLALVAAGALAIGCTGGGDGRAEPGPTAAPELATTELPEAAPRPGTTAEATTATTTTAEVHRGGKLVMGIEAETASPWRPAEAICIVSCHQVIRSVFDPLALLTEDGGWAPYLAAAIEADPGFTVWTITLRPGVRFHDGTPLDAAAVIDNLKRQRSSFLGGKVLDAVTSIAAAPDRPDTVVVTMSRSWPSFPYLLTGSTGYMASPAWLAASDADETLRSQPVGTGPFVLADYRPNEVFRATRNPDYWNQPFPFLDEIEFRPIPDGTNRRDALRTGAVDLIHTTTGEHIVELREDDDFVLHEIDFLAETNFTMLHVSQVLADGTPSALTDRRVRCALAHASDNQTLNDTFGGGVSPVANGPFSPTQPGYLADTGFPVTQDMAEAQRLIAEYKSDHPGPLRLSLATTQDDSALTFAQFQQQWFEEAGVDEVTIDQLDQGAYITQALQGNFQAFQWRNHGGPDLDGQYLWWHSSLASPLGQLATNFGRIRDPRIDALLDQARTEADPERKRRYAEDINRIFAEECYGLWGSWAIWGVAHASRVHGVGSFTLPDGEVAGFGSGIAGTFPVLNLWVDR